MQKQHVIVTRKHGLDSVVHEGRWAAFGECPLICLSNLLDPCFRAPKVMVCDRLTGMDHPLLVSSGDS